MARLGQRVLLVDADPQGHLTLGLGFPKNLKVTLKNMMENIIMGIEFEPREAILSHKEGVDVIPSNKLLTGMDMSLITVDDRECVLKEYLELLQDDYDYIIIDCMPSLGMLTINAILDKDGNKIYDPKKRQYKCKSIPATDWNEQTKAEEWRAAWAGLCNQVLEQNGHAERIDHRSYERQGIDQIPTVHLGVAASAMEKRGIRTERGDLNREIEVTNQKLRQLKARISKLQDWLKEEQENTEPPTLADYIQGILSRKAQAGKPGYSQSLYNLKDAAKMLNFLQANSIMDMAGLDEKFKSMIGEQLDIQGKLKPVERRLGTLKKHLEQADIYFKCKGKKPLTEAEQLLFTTAKDYLKGVMNGKTTIPTKAWKEEYTKLTAERKTLNQRYLALKEEVKEAEKIRKSVYSILRQEQREQQPHRKQDMER